MPKRVILITGTPAVGKTTLAQNLASHLQAQYVNLTDFAKQEQLILEADPQRDTLIIDEAKMKRKLRTLITKAQTDVVIDGHYAAAVVSPTLTTHVFVLRRHPKELQQFMQQRGYSPAKQDENLAAEILDVCLTETLQTQKSAQICELDTTAKPPENVLADVLAVLDGKKPCYTKIIDWLGTLEREGTLSMYLKEA
jgi:adenylate kinase